MQAVLQTNLHPICPLILLFAGKIAPITGVPALGRTRLNILAQGGAARGRGVYFHSDIRLAEPFAGDDGRIIRADIILEHPAIRDECDTPGQEASEAEAGAFSDALVEAGHDGLIVEHEFSGREIVVFEVRCIRIIDPDIILPDRQTVRAASAGVT